MARKHFVATPDDGALILPRVLANHTGLTAAEYRAFCQARNGWFRARGIDPGDWSGGVYPILKATWSAYGIENRALGRARRRWVEQLRRDRR